MFQQTTKSYDFCDMRFNGMVKISKQYLGYYANYSLFNFKGSKLEVTKIGIYAQICISVRQF